jgi:hypothetical protein
MQTLVDVGKLAGYVSRKEPRLHARPANVKPTDKGYDKHADILMMRHADLLYIDVFVCRPTSPSAAKAALAIQNIPLQSTLHGAAKKRVTYGTIAQANHYQLIPFAIETYGGLGLDAQRLLAKLAESPCDYSASQLLQLSRQRLSVTLQFGNANVLLQAVQDYQYKQYERNEQSHQAVTPGSRRYYKRRENSYPHLLHRQLQQTARHITLSSSGRPVVSVDAAVADPSLALDFAANVEVADINMDVATTAPADVDGAESAVALLAC